MSSENFRSLFIYSLATLVIILPAAVAGCSRNVPKQPVEVIYDVARPEWIQTAGTKNIPAELLEKRIDTVQIETETVWFGVRDYGLARLDTGSGTWDLFDAGKFSKRLEIHDVATVGGLLYVATAGSGLLAMDLESGAWARAGTEDNPGPKNAIRLETAEDVLWMAGTEGLFTFDTTTKKIKLIEKGKFFGLTCLKNEAWLLGFAPNLRVTLASFDLSTREKTWGCIGCPGLNLPTQYMFTNNKNVLITTVKGLSILDVKSKEFKDITAPEEIPYFIPFIAATFGDGYIFGTESGLIYCDRAGKSWLIMGPETGLPGGMITGLAAAGEVLYVGTEKGIFIIGPARWEEMKNIARREWKKTPTQDPDDPVETILSGGSEDVNPWFHVTTRNGLLHNRIFSLLVVDDEVWIGTSYLGLSVLSLKDFSVESFRPDIDPKEMPLHLPVMELAADGDEIWHGGYQLYGRFDRSAKKWLEMTRYDKDLSPSDIEALLIEPEKVWLGVRKKGLWVIDRIGSDIKKYAGDFMTVSPYITDVVRAGNSIWIGADTGLKRYNPEADNFDFAGIETYDIESIFADGDTLWIGSRERTSAPGPNNTGLYRFNLRTRHLVAFHEADAPCIRVNKIIVDGPMVWVAARDGLHRYCRLHGEWTTYGRADGLDAEDFTAVAVNADKLIVGTDNGLFVKNLFQFVAEKDRSAYKKAWKLEKAGEYRQAAELYGELLKSSQFRNDSHIRYRVARCLQLDGNFEQATNYYKDLLKEYPLLLLDLESIYTELYGFEDYIREIKNLARKYKQEDSGRKLCDAYARHVEPAIKRFALLMEKKGNISGAADYWKLLADNTVSEVYRTEAEERLKKLQRKSGGK